MVKSYLKYEQAQNFGVVATASSNTVWSPETASSSNAPRTTSAGRAYAGANEQVLCWDIKKGELLSTWRDADCTAAVTCIVHSKADHDIFAVGYEDGSIRLWDSKIGTVVINFNGHRSAITTLAFNSAGTRLASGAKDTDIIIWDLIGETGLFKLRGHKDQITGLSFIQLPQPTGSTGENGMQMDVPISEEDSSAYIIATSKDAMIKIWDVSQQYCLETHVTQSNGECWALGMPADCTGCITAGIDGELRVWSLDLEGLRALGSKIGETASKGFLYDRGTILRQTKDRTIGIAFHPTADYIAVHGSDKAVDVWRVRSPEEVQKSQARKRRRQREKAAAAGDDDADMDMANGDDHDTTVTDVTEVFRPLVTVRTGGKVRSVDWAAHRAGKSIQLLVGTTNNQLELYSVSTPLKKTASKEPPEYNRALAVELPGHRTDVRAISLSSDDRMLATASSGSLKIWNVQTTSCLRTLECGYALCCSFLPGDKIVLVGNKNGELELFDITSSALIDTIKAHDGAIWTLRVHPDGKSVVTGSADKTAKFWRFDIVQEEIPGTKRTTPRLKLVHKRTLKVADDVLNLCFSPDARLLAVATLDITVKVFFVDTLKQFLNLYGHKLPVLSISISSDSKLIATSSADKNVRLWGLDFGDCHKSFFAHDDSIMQVSFIPHPFSKENNHFFFSASKDGFLRSWDGDKFEAVQRLSGHHGEIWAMAVSRGGDFAVTASHDKSIRIWAQSDEPLFLEEERERELEELYDSNLAASLERDQANVDALGEGSDDGVAADATKQTASTLTAGEKITEALTMCMEDLQLMQEHEQLLRQKGVDAATAVPPQRHPLLALRGISAEAHLLSVVAAIPAASLHDALLLLSFTQLPALFTFVAIWLRKDMNVPLTCRILFFQLRTHHRQIVASSELRGIIGQIQVELRRVLGEWKDVVGFNLAGTKVLSRRIRESNVGSVEDVMQEKDENVANGLGVASGKKRGFLSMA